MSGPAAEVEATTHLEPVEVAGWRLEVPAAWQRHTRDDGLTLISGEETTDPILLRLEVTQPVPSFDAHVGAGIAELQLSLTDPLLIDVEAVDVAGVEAARALALHRAGAGIGALDVVWIPHGDVVLSVVGSTSHRTRPTLAQLLDRVLPTVAVAGQETSDD
ncbi:MAG: hypothetical protein JJT89_05005 [Nitriliruptoraceae bacterium]|nr:hypothetical protein [Nitriliruptoraceae bacterium]